MRGSKDVTIPPKLTMQLRDRLARAGWDSEHLALITVPGAVNGSPELAAPRRIGPRLRDLLRHTLDLDVPRGQVRRLARLGYLPANATPSNTSNYALSQAIMAFQGWNGIERDGTAGPETQKRLATAGRPKARRSGGGKWLIEAPYVMQAAIDLQYPLGWAVQIYNAAEALPNLINPFWMLPLLGVLGLVVDPAR